jgi:hypothetical protein
MSLRDMAGHPRKIRLLPSFGLHFSEAFARNAAEDGIARRIADRPTRDAEGCDAKGRRV